MRLASAVLFGAALLVFVGLFQIPAAAQGEPQGGCNLFPIFDKFVDCCNGLGNQPSEKCADGGDPGDFCSISMGSCEPCGNHWFVATTHPDPTCNPPECDVQPPASCQNWSWEQCRCINSPIVVDLTGEGFRLTSPQDGVDFDFYGRGAMRIAWTRANSGNAFLVLDRNGNGVIDNGMELFGNATPQPSSTNPHGFLALAEFDKLAAGGNSDDLIDEHDAVFSQLRLWLDQNHDGVSQPSELRRLDEMNVQSLSLAYKYSKRTDEFGNELRYRAKVNQKTKGDESEVGKWSYDVFLMSGNPAAVQKARLERKSPTPTLTRRSCSAGLNLALFTLNERPDELWVLRQFLGLPFGLQVNRGGVQ